MTEAVGDRANRVLLLQNWTQFAPRKITFRAAGWQIRGRCDAALHQKLFEIPPYCSYHWLGDCKRSVLNWYVCKSLCRQLDSSMYINLSAIHCSVLADP